ncbi:LysR family transcriptional regulator [Alicyclobacillus sp. ALC3]|uniref:LysR family transcriptional regulator n=1 Tax=Alicyclobacillus sp. ALC3 TaxID=2796143 RepID=UPI002379DF1F|nr:LysR family transcriptional regulator [Alicyclobacillus sp. ALC3]WDL97596.1 LysR family transcriptional regulator [Alicyclobacillus sp. ALC3]
MHLESHEVFCAVVEHGSLNKTAQVLHMTQSTASRHLQAMEDEYGGLLFERSASGLTLTPLGQALYPYSRDLLSCHVRAKEELLRLRSEGGGLCVGATLSIGEYLLPVLLGDLRERYPSADIRMRIANTTEIVSQLAHHSIDVGLVEGIVTPTADLVVTAWKEDDLVLVCPPSHRFAQKGEISLADVLEEPLLCREEGSGTRQVTEQALEQENMLSQATFCMELGSTQAIKSAIVAGLGVAFLSRLTVHEDCQRGVLVEVPIAGFQIRRHLHIVQRAERYSRYMVDAFLRLLDKAPL